MIVMLCLFIKIIFITGQNDKHYTAQVLYQHASYKPPAKPSISVTGLKKTNLPSHAILPCQEVPPHPRPLQRPSISDDFLIVENTEVDVSKFDEASSSSQKIEFVISMVRCVNTEGNIDSSSLPQWSGIHALIATEQSPLMRVAFAPVLPYPVTQYEVVRKSLNNFQNILCQLENQPIFPLACDEGVFKVIVDILLAEPNTFADIFPILGGFHTQKTLLRCCGAYITGCGMNDALIETNTFGKKTVLQALTGKHYVRALHAMLLIKEVIEKLQWAAFFEKEGNDSMPQSFGRLQDALSQRKRSNCASIFAETKAESSAIHSKFKRFVQECTEKSELCRYFQNFVEIVKIVLMLISADRNGNWLLHVSAMDSAMPIFREFDAFNYLRYGSWYLERIKVLEVEYPSVYEQFMKGSFVIRDRENSYFSSVAADLKLEQTINRFSQGPGGHVVVGSSGKISVVAEFDILYHEMLALHNLFSNLMKDDTSGHLETVVHHTLGGRKSDKFNSSVTNLFDYVNGNYNPYLKADASLPLHNFVSKITVPSAASSRILQVFENGSERYKTFRNERYVEKNKKMFDRISLVKLPRFDPSEKHGLLLQDQVNKTGSKSTQKENCKNLSAAKQLQEVALARGLSQAEILSHDLLPESVIFEGDFCTKTSNKAAIVSEIEACLSIEDKAFNRTSSLHTEVIIDFMSSARQTVAEPDAIFGDIVDKPITRAQAACKAERYHLVYDSYNESSKKSGEWLRRGGGDALTLSHLEADTPLPRQMDKFWRCSENKMNFQLLSRERALAKSNNMVVSGIIHNEELLPAKRRINGAVVEIQELESWENEADQRLIVHLNWAIINSAKRVVVFCNDSDVVVLLLRYYKQWLVTGLKELWVNYGTGQNRRMLPIHAIFDRLGADVCGILVKVHLLTGDDCHSKFGTKHAAVKMEPVKYLAKFAENPVLCDEEIERAEEYLVRVWAGANVKTSAKTFNELRLIAYKSTKGNLSELPPTSLVAKNHIRRCWYSARVNLNLLAKENLQNIRPEAYGWDLTDGLMKPDKCLLFLPSRYIVTCRCKGSCMTNQCKCRKSGVGCVFYCHGVAGTNNSCRNVCF